MTSIKTTDDSQSQSVTTTALGWQPAGQAGKTKKQTRKKRTLSTTRKTKTPYRQSKRLPKKKKTLADGSEPEKFIQKRILNWLDSTGLLNWRQQSGMIMVGSRAIRIGVEGLPDIIVVVPPTGRLLGLEVKSKNGSLRPAQKAIRARMEASGAVYRVVRSLQEAMDAVASTLGENRCPPSSLLN